MAKSLNQNETHNSMDANAYGPVDLRPSYNLTIQLISYGDEPWIHWGLEGHGFNHKCFVVRNSVCATLTIPRLQFPSTLYYFIMKVVQTWLITFRSSTIGGGYLKWWCDY